MDRVRLRVKDKRVLRLVKAFLKAGILTELGEVEDTHTGTPQGGILSPLLANIALSVLDEHLHAPWKPGGTMSTRHRRQDAVDEAEPNWRVVRYADDFVVLVRRRPSTTSMTCASRSLIVLAPLGLRLSEAKTQIVHMSEGFDFLGFHIQWKRKRGTNKWYVYTFIADRRQGSAAGRSSGIGAGSMLAAARPENPGAMPGGLSAMMWAWSMCPECRVRRWTG